MKKIETSSKDHDNSKSIDDLIFATEACIELLNSDGELNSKSLDKLKERCSNIDISKHGASNTSGSYVSFPHVICSFDRFWVGIEKIDHIKWPLAKLPELADVILHFIGHFPIGLLLKANNECFAICISKPGYVLFDVKQRDGAKGPHLLIVGTMNALISHIEKQWLGKEKQDTEKPQSQLLQPLEITIVKRSSSTSYDSLPDLPRAQPASETKTGAEPEEKQEVEQQPVEEAQLPVEAIKDEVDSETSSSELLTVPSSSSDSEQENKAADQESKAEPNEGASMEANADEDPLVQKMEDDEEELEQQNAIENGKSSSTSSADSANEDSSSSSSSSSSSDEEPTVEFDCCLCHKAQTHDMLFKHESCQHKFDRECARARMLQVIELGSLCPINVLKCPDESCEADVPLEEVEAVLEPQEKRLLRKQLLQSGVIHRINCPEAGCGGVQFLTPHTRFHCPECGHSAFVFSDS